MLTGIPERRLLAQLNDEFDRFMTFDAVAYRALRDGRDDAVRRIFLGPEIRNFEGMAITSERLAR